MMTSITLKTGSVAALLVLAGCASTPGAQPQDMSKAQHEQAAAQHEQMAEPHAAAFDPNASAVKTTCGDPRRPCWTSTSNPTEEHKADAEKHRKMAADHRAAAQSLRDAEARSCAGIDDADRDTSPFDHREDIVGVTPYNVSGPVGLSPKQQTTQLHGAVISFRAVKGMTAEWFQRIVDCHLARNASLGNEMPEMAYCPLNEKGTKAKVASMGNGFAVTVESDDPTIAKDILHRAESLKAK
jgi:hypothetical protein